MDYQALLETAEVARTGKKLTAAQQRFVRETVPEELADFPKMPRAAKLSHPAGFSVSGAPVGTFLRGALLLAGQKALGRRFGGSAFYERVEADLAMRIMRSHFHGGAPKGAYCCSQCTLGILPVLEAGAIRWFECKPLAKDVRRMIETKSWRFRSAPNPKMLAWALAN